MACSHSPADPTSKDDRELDQRCRRRKVVAHKARSFEEAAAWDLEYWLARSPQARLEALEELRREWETIRHARNQ